MIVEAVLRAGNQTLRSAGIDDPTGDARKLLAEAMGVAASRLTLLMKDAVGEDVQARFDALVTRRAARVPVSHLIGRRAFWGRDFIITAEVLDPRPETETLVAKALERPFLTVLDLGTGSGAILLSLLAERPDAQGTGTDMSQAALAVAARNATALDVADRTTLIASDWCAAVTGTFDLIVSNPPYIAAAEMPGLSPEVHDHEPHLALTDGADGLTAYRAILAQAVAHLSPGGRVLLEIGPTQAADLARLATEHDWSGFAVHPDLDGRDRVVELRQTPLDCI